MTDARVGEDTWRRGDIHCQFFTAQGAADCTRRAVRRGNPPAEGFLVPLCAYHAEQAVHLADLSGDGLPDLVRIRNGEVCYWPNLGFGKFGAKIIMGNAPRFSAAADFSQANVRLADVDGSGTTDILYCDGDEVRYWLNLAGNSFSSSLKSSSLVTFFSTTSASSTMKSTTFSSKIGARTLASAL